MATSETELTAPVDLCTADGNRLNPAAVGWSREPLHTANLRGRWGRNKKWDYWGILLGDAVVSVTFASLDYAGLAAVDWADFTSGDTGGASHITPLARSIDLPDFPGSRPLRCQTSKLRVEVTDLEGGTRIVADWASGKARRDALDVFVAQPAGHESLNVVVPWSDTRFQYTSKQQARPVTGTLRIGDTIRRIGGETPAWATLDVGRGRWPYRARWNWAAGAGTSTDGHVIGIQMGAKWTEGTGSTENGILVDGRLTKIGEELEWDYDIDRPMLPWHVRSADGALDLTLVPVHDKPSTINAGIFANTGHQVFGAWSGTVPHDDGDPLTLADDVVGFAEEISWRW